jgi:PIN domain nuclease of toxin-antitoxin system
VRDALRNSNELWLSSVSIWEALFLNAKGRSRLPANLSEVAERRYRIPAISGFPPEIVLLQIGFSVTAQVLDLTLVTPDDNLFRLGTIRTMKV